MTPLEGLWPYLLLLVAAVLPNEVFRIAGVLLARGLDERSEIFTWVRIVALALLAAVVSKIVWTAPAALGRVPTVIPALAVAVAVAAFFLSRRRLLAAMLAGEGVLIGGAWLAGA